MTQSCCHAIAVMQAAVGVIEKHITGTQVLLRDTVDRDTRGEELFMHTSQIGSQTETGSPTNACIHRANNVDTALTGTHSLGVHTGTGKDRACALHLQRATFQLH